ncbi:TIR domain-containing protein [Mycobacterium intracellulare]|uniref:TIR domain-containing protein n=1 Tax=Mycobacterium intracellulare TaxID=1767 RepID=UPI001CD99F45|nr:TIR domain-containing protein [Mycobacterium intracellulare]MCA2306668.1 TIR domain-containing protein [Mycobacterium intracellulare]MCA2348912.1 TIR domain-containing protein [Mycobacterium intracellulare]
MAKPGVETSESEADDDDNFKYDVAVSFAGEQRQFVETVVRVINLPEGRVFYDFDYVHELWGEDLAEYLTRLYSKEARYVVMFISREYAEKVWTRVERRAALSRRARTQGAYILPVRLDTTELEEIDGLLNTIGYLDGQLLGAEKVGEILNKKLTALQEKAAASDDQDEGPKFGQIAHDAEGLAALVQARPHSWQWAAFGSVLVQRREALKPQLRDQQLGFGPPTGERIANTEELKDLIMNTVEDVLQNGEQLAGIVQTEGFRAAIGELNEVSSDADHILHVANRLMDHYERFLQLAQRVRGVATRSAYRTVLDTCARLVDKPISGLDRFIDDYVSTVEELPTKLTEAAGQDIHLSIVMPIDVDGELTTVLFRQLRDLLGLPDED